MNESFYRIIRSVVLALLAIVCAIFIYLYIGERRTTGKLAEDHKSTTDKLELKIGELASERQERLILDERYRELEKRYTELGESIPDFVTGLSDIESGLGSVASELQEIGDGLQTDIDGLSGIANEIGAVIAEAKKQEHSLSNNNSSDSD